MLIRRGCLFYDAAHGEFLAEHIAGAIVERHDDVNDPWWVGDTNAIVAAIDRFVGSRGD